MLINLLTPVLIECINFPWLPQFTGFGGNVIEGSSKVCLCLLRAWRRSEHVYVRGETSSVVMQIGSLLNPGTLVLGSPF